MASAGRKPAGQATAIPNCVTAPKSVTDIPVANTITDDKEVGQSPITNAVTSAKGTAPGGR